LPADVVAALGVAEPDGVDDDTALLIRAADQLIAEHELDDRTWSALSERFDEAQLIELCVLVGGYAMIAGTLRSLRVPLEDGLAAPDWRS
jgi:alkylhydroperoxidase family enzyme